MDFGGSLPASETSLSSPLTTLLVIPHLCCHSRGEAKCRSGLEVVNGASFAMENAVHVARSAAQGGRGDSSGTDLLPPQGKQLSSGADLLAQEGEGCCLSSWHGGRGACPGQACLLLG